MPTWSDIGPTTCVTWAFGEVNNISKTDVQIALHKKEIGYTELENIEMLMLIPKIVAA